MIMRLAAAGMGMPMEMEASCISLRDLPLIDHIEARAGFTEKIPVMGDDHIGNVKLIENLNKFFPDFFIKIIGRLIQEHGFRLHGEHCGQGDQFFFAP